MPFHIVRNDLANMHVDAVVNAANPGLLAGGGVCGAIFRAAGFRDLSEACRAIGGCAVGEAVATPAFALPARYVIHAVGPIWQGGSMREAELLRQCYDRSLALAVDLGIESIAFPLISAGAFGYPKSSALAIALESFASFLLSHDLLIYLVVFDRESFHISETLFESVRSYIDDTYEDSYDYGGTRLLSDFGVAATNFEESKFRGIRDNTPAQLADCVPSCGHGFSDSLTDLVNNLDESFSECLLRLIDERNMTDVEVYKRANISRKLFSKIRGNQAYHPSKPTVFAFAIALKLSIAETSELLEKAGFAFSHASKLDVIVEYFLAQQLYDIFVVNEALFAFDQVLLGS